MISGRFRIAGKLQRLCFRNCQSRWISIKEAVADGSFGDIPLENYRNFSIIAHVDHGKSTLADAILQMTGNIDEKERLQGQVLDSLKVERERGITVKAQTASMLYTDNRTKQTYLLNLIDTPGHVDFSYEVIRSLASCQGALLLVDSSQSVQAQTLANHGYAKSLGLSLIPVVTKIDLPAAQPEETALNMSTTFDLDPDDCIMTSAREKIGIQEILEAVVQKLPPPTGDCELEETRLKARIVDSWFEEHRGMVCLVQVISGELYEGQRIITYASMNETDTKGDYSVQEVGLLTPTTLRTKRLLPGQVGYVVSGMRSTRQARIGDTVYCPSQWQQSATPIQPLEGYEPAKQMLFASVYPVDTLETDLLYSSVDRLCLNDSSVSVTRDQSLSLGSGLRCGFLGFLHMEVFMQRLRDEFNINVIMTSPSVPYIVEYNNGDQKHISTIDEFPISASKHGADYRILEPYVSVVLVTPATYYGPMVEIMKEKRAEDLSVVYLDDGTVKVSALMPWQEVVCDMSDMVKQYSSGYANFNYTTDQYRESNLSKVEIAVNGEICEALSFIAHKMKAPAQGRRVALKLKENLSRQQFEIIIQAKVGNKILCRERIAPYRKDVLDSGKGGVIGQGDVTRKKKLLQKQKEGKKRAKMVGKVEIGQEAFWSVLNRE